MKTHFQWTRVQQKIKKLKKKSKLNKTNQYGNRYWDNIFACKEPIFPNSRLISLKEDEEEEKSNTHSHTYRHTNIFIGSYELHIQMKCNERDEHDQFGFVTSFFFLISFFR